jgi:hypothetical protein
MKRAWVEFGPEASRGFLDLHQWSRPDGPRRWITLPPEEWEPPIRPVPGKGYPRIFVELDNFVFEFISTREMLYAATVLEQRLVDPDTAKQRWYVRLPASIKAQRTRGRAAALLRKVAAAYEAQLPEILKEPSPVPQQRGRRRDHWTPQQSGDRNQATSRVDIRL